LKLFIPAEQSRSWLENSIGLSDETRKLYGKRLVVTIKAQSPAHTPEQQGLYWSTLHEWGRELGYSVKETETILHNMVLCEAYGVASYVEFKGARWPVPKERSSGQDVEHYSLLIQTLMNLTGH